MLWPLSRPAALRRPGLLLRRQTILKNNHPTQRRGYFNAKDPIRPYSDSLPHEGYEWCARCQIRTHKFQKPQGQHNACLDAPRLFGLGVCAPARQYYQQQVTHMIFLSLFCFAAAPIYNQATFAQEEDDA